jgi:uncharacterized protein
MNQKSENAVEQGFMALGPNDTFCFECTKEVPCFNECCRDLNQFLTPYDILRMKKSLKLSSAQFLKAYTAQHIGPETGLPVVTLKAEYASGWQCPFVTAKGCRIYEDRPASCRSYPLARMAYRDPNSGEIAAQYALLKESHCKGFERGAPKTIDAWIKAQGLAHYNEANDWMIDIIGLKRRLGAEPLDLAMSRMFVLACYDLDTLREQIEAGKIMPDVAAEAIPADDMALLKFGLDRAKKMLQSSTGQTL